MAEIVTMPKLGFDMAEGTLVRWLVNEGDPVAKGAVLAEIETDKATVEVESTHEGIVARHLVSTGEIVPVNTPIAVIAGPGENIEDAAKAASAGERAGQEATVETAKAASTPSANPYTAPMAQEPPAAAPAMKTPDSLDAPKGAALQASVPATGQNDNLPDGVRASPLARRMAFEMRIDLNQVTGSGPAGRITRRDIEAFLKAPAAVAPSPQAAPVPPAPAPSAAKVAPVVPLTPLSTITASQAPADESIPLNRLRAAIGRRMVESKQQVPHFYVTHEYDVAALLDLRKQVNLLLPEEEKISVNDFIVKAAALTLRQFPNLNAALQGDQVVRYGKINIGVAVAVDNGLLTVVVRDADRKPLRQIAVEVKEMAGRVRSGKVKPDDIEGSTFSTSNLGMYNVTDFVAIINPPEAAILAIGSALEIPVVKDGQLTIGWRMKITISVDHRVSDGAEGARYMQALADYIEAPLRLVI